MTEPTIEQEPVITVGSAPIDAHGALDTSEAAWDRASAHRRTVFDGVAEANHIAGGLRQRFDPMPIGDDAVSLKEDIKLLLLRLSDLGRDVEDPGGVAVGRGRLIQLQAEFAELFRQISPAGVIYPGLEPFRRAELKNLDESAVEIELSGTRDFIAVHFDGSDVPIFETKKTLSGVLFVDSHFENVSFRGVEFASDVSLVRTRFTNCDFTGAKAVGLRGSSLIFDSCDFSDADFSQSSFGECVWKGPGRTVDEKADTLFALPNPGWSLREASISYSKFEGMTFGPDSVLTGAVFSTSALDDCSIMESHAQSTIFCEVQLSGSLIYGSNLSRASFVNSDIRGVRFFGGSPEDPKFESTLAATRFGRAFNSDQAYFTDKQRTAAAFEED